MKAVKFIIAAILMTIIAQVAHTIGAMMTVPTSG